MLRVLVIIRYIRDNKEVKGCDRRWGNFMICIDELYVLNVYVLDVMIDI